MQNSLIRIVIKLKVRFEAHCTGVRQEKVRFLVQKFFKKLKDRFR